MSQMKSYQSFQIFFHIIILLLFHRLEKHCLKSLALNCIEFKANINQISTAFCKSRGKEAEKLFIL